MRKKKKVRCIQTRLFDDDEIKVKTKSSKPKRYTPYIKGAVDMFLKFLKEYHDEELLNIIHLPRPYMEVFVKRAVKDKDFLNQFLSGMKPKFSVDRDSCGEIKTIKVSLQNVLHQKEVEV